MRRAAALSTVAVLLAAGPATSAARGVTFADPAGDADFTGGQAAPLSQAAYDVVAVTLTPAEVTRTTATIGVRIELAGAAAVAPGTAFYLTGRQGDCTFTVTRAAGVDSWVETHMLQCPPAATRGAYSTQSVRTVPPLAGKVVTFTVPRAALADSRIGAKVTSIEAGTAIADPVTGTATPAHPDTASYQGTYAVGS